MFKWFNILPDAAKGAVFGALVGSSIAAVIGIITILTKDYLIPILTERRVSKNLSKRTFRKYANPLILSSISWLYRIREIFYRGHFLLDTTPRNLFNQYKYISSLYRLCVLIGWIRASKIELSLVEVKSSKDYRLIDAAIFDFEESLANGEHIEQSVLEHLGRIWGLDVSKLVPIEKKKLGVSIENFIDKHCFEQNVEVPTLLTDEKKLELAYDVCDLICGRANCSKIARKVIGESLQTSIKEMSRVEGLLYRDWQSAIGDLMIKPAISGSDRKFEVVGFKEFEQMFHSEELETKKWFDRINRLFRNLDVEVEERFDARTLQLKNVYKATYKLLEAYSKVQMGNIDITKNALTNLKEL